MCLNTYYQPCGFGGPRGPVYWRTANGETGRARAGGGTMAMLIKAVLGAAVVVLIAALSKSRSYYVAGLVPLFPTFSLIAHYIVGSERSTADLRATILFGMG